jgi:bifunctional DNase/RNase
MKFSELKIVGLSYSQSQIGSYVLVLSEKKKKSRKLPIIIKEDPAQFIALSLEGVKTQRPLVYDLFKKVTDNLGADLYEIRITHILEGIFHAKIVFHNMVEEFEIESTISDAICLSVTYGCPILCAKEVIEVAGISMDDDGNISDEQQEENYKPRKASSLITVEHLEIMLTKAIENEEYEVASQLRDKISEMKEKKQK